MAEPALPFGRLNKSISGRVKKIIHNVKWLTIFALFGRASWLITLLLIGRDVGPALFGEFSAYMAFWLITSRFFGLGLEIWVNKNIASTTNETKRGKITAISETLRLLLVGTGCGLILTASYFLPEGFIDYYPMFLLLAFRQIAESLREVQVGVLQGREQMKVQTLALIPWDALQIILVFLCTIFLTTDHLNLLVALLVVTSFGKIITLEAAIRVVTTLKPKLKDISFEDYRNTAGESFFFGLGMLLALGLGKVDILLLRSFVSPEIVGNYSMAYLFLNVCTIILGILRQSIFPSLANYATNAKDKFLRLACLSSLFFFVAGLIGALLLGLLGPLLLQISGRSFTDAPYLLILLACSLPWVALSGSLGNAVNAAGLARKGVVAQAAGLVSNIVANLFWIPLYGGAGAAFATLLAYSVQAFGCAYIIRSFKPRLSQ